jgi:S1-C subfamily serine protease
VRTNDIIVAIDGTPIGDVLHTPAAIDTASQAAVTTLTVLRDGEEITVEASQQAAETSLPALRARQQRAGG